MTNAFIGRESLSRRLLALTISITATIAIALALAPATAFADETVSFGGEDIAAGNQVYLGSWVILILLKPKRIA